MASLPTEPTTTVRRYSFDELLASTPVELIQQAARQQVAAMAAELEAHKLAVTAVRQFCGVRAKHGPDNVASKSAQHVLDLLADLP